MSEGLDKGDAFDYRLEQIADEFELEPNPIPGPKWKANLGVLRLHYLCGASKDVLHCLIELAHEHWGFAFPSKKYIQRWTRRSRYSVDRALAKIRRLGLTSSTERRLDYDHSQSTLEVINWPPLFEAYQRVQKLRKKVMPSRHQREALCENAQTVRENAQTLCENAVHSYSYLSESKGSGSTPPEVGAHPFENLFKGVVGSQSPTSQQAERFKGFSGGDETPSLQTPQRTVTTEVVVVPAEAVDIFIDRVGSDGWSWIVAQDDLVAAANDLDPDAGAELLVTAYRKAVAA